jgi:hypothetical protein
MTVNCPVHAMRSILMLSIALVSAVSSGAAFADKTAVTVSAQSNIYGAGQDTPPGGGKLPPSVSLKAH